MYYTLFHNNTPVCLLLISENFSVERIEKVYDYNRIPVGLKEHLTAFELHNWLFSRAIPDKRPGLHEILEKKNVENSRELLVKNRGLSLCDHYWIKNDAEQCEWNDVNFFNNDFGNESDDIFIGEDIEYVNAEHTPNSASSGMLPKKWIIQNGERYMIKGSESIYRQEPYNEIAASLFLDSMKIPHVNYDFYPYKGMIYSICKNMLGEKNELISAFYMSKILTRDKEKSHYEHYVKCVAFNAPYLDVKMDIRSKLEQMIAVDYLIANTDRHWSNFGIIRNAETLQVEYLAPLYDNGAAFFTHYHHKEIPAKNRFLKCLSFKSKQDDNIKLISDFSWVNKNAMYDLAGILENILSKNELIDMERRNAIIKGIQERTIMLNRYIERGGIKDDT